MAKSKRVRRFKPERIEKMSARDIVRISEDRLRKASKQELFNLVNRAQNLFGKRMHSIYKSGLGDFAYASQYKIDPLEAAVAPTDRYEASHLLAMFRQFFSSKTSTVKGIKDFIETEEKRLSDLAGREIKFDDADSRSRFWSFYMEFLKQFPQFDEKQNSERIQQVLGEMNFWEYRGFTAGDLIDALGEFEERYGK